MTIPDHIEGTSSERSRLVHNLRSLATVLPILTLVLLTGATAAGSPRPWSSGSSTTNTTSPSSGLVPAALESSARPGAPIRAVPQSPNPGPPAEVEPAPPPAGRLVTGPVERLVDTRDAGVDRPPTTIDLPATDPTITGLVLSVSLIGSEQAGTVTIEGPAGTVEVLTVGGPGATTTNGLVVVPGSGPARLLNPAGGHLVVDLIGHFSASGPSAAGRLLGVEPVRLAHLVTATDGRELQFELDGGRSDPSAAALVVVTADVGEDGGRVAIGPAPGQPTQMLMWGPPVGPDQQRSGVVLVVPGPDGRVAIRYDGGSVLDVDLIARVTGEGAAVSSAGLFVPVASIDTLDLTVPSGTTAVAPAAPGAATALVGLRADPGGRTPEPTERLLGLTGASGQTIGTLLPIGPGPDGRPAILVTSTADREARIQPVGHLLAPAP